ncbi:hypothetical protein UPYG_G00255290 [Umbra pygmaea]|uniref:Uncharacterized protein n=1 Tax=Umbra pygmaea TaxID=75934 RepID=A0ABD0WCU6_UMBPY
MDILFFLSLLGDHRCLHVGGAGSQSSWGHATHSLTTTISALSVVRRTLTGLVWQGKGDEAWEDRSKNEKSEWSPAKIVLSPCLRAQHDDNLNQTTAFRLRQQLELDNLESWLAFAPASLSTMADVS